MKFFIGLVVIVCLSYLSCGYVYHDIIPGDKNKLLTAPKNRIKASTKVHLLDGSLIIFKKGFIVIDDSLKGEGIKYNLTRNHNSPVLGELIQNVVSLEYYENKGGAGLFWLSSPTVIMGSLIVGAMMSGAGTSEEIYKAIFGSCPTFFSLAEGKYHLEAEGFSYSISRLLETEDLDRLNFVDGLKNTYTLKIANQALETHYINQIQLLSVEHPPKYSAYPNEKRQILLVGKKEEKINITNKCGLSITNLVSNQDSLWYQSDSILLKDLSKKYTEDWLDLKFAVPQHVEKVYLTFRIRNTLLNTILLYDVMMKSQGYNTLDWFHSELSNFFYVWNLYKWYKKYFGIHISIFDGKSYVEIARIPDTGPLAWHDVAVEVPIKNHSDVAIRIKFLPDNWMIDLINVSFEGRCARNLKQLTCNEITDHDNNEKNEYLDLINDKDKRYLLTFPGDNYNLNFKLPISTNGNRKTFFLKSKGYYIEWLREDWFKNKNLITDDNNKFELNEEAIIKTAQLWIEKKGKFEAQFFNSKFSIK